MSDTKRKSVIYKQAKFKASEQTLQELLTLTINQVDKPGSRKESIDHDGKCIRVLNRTIDRNGVFLGELLLWEEGKTQSAVSQDDAGFYTVESLGLPSGTEDGRKREYLESQLIFAVHKNHLAVMQSRTLKAQQLEAHLLWLVSRFTDVLEPESYFVLSDEPTLEAKRKIIESGGVKDINLGFPIRASQFDSKGNAIEPHSVVSSHKPNTVTNVKDLLFRPLGKANDILTAVFGEDWARMSKLADSLDDANLELELKVKYVRKTTEEAHQLLDEMATIARHLDSDFTRINLKNGVIIKGEEMKITGFIKVPYIGELIDLNQLFTELRTWLYERFSTDELT
jgi:hypothetical protein